MEVSMIIAENLKRLRQERNLSLGKLSALCGVSKVMLSQIERCETNPTVNTIWKIALGPKVPYTSLLDQRPHSAQLVRAEQLQMQLGDTPAYRVYCYYAAAPQRNFELFRVELDAGGAHHSLGHGEKMQEYLLVTRGELCVLAGEQTYHLRAQDSLCFDASMPHTYRNAGDTMAEIIMQNVYPY